MIRSYLIAGLAVALAGSIVWAVWQDRRADGLEDANAALRRSVAALEAARDFQAELARQANDARIAAETREARKDRAIETLLTGDFADGDTPVDPRIRSLLECLRTGAGDCVPAP